MQYAHSEPLTAKHACMKQPDTADISGIVEMAWADDIPFDSIEAQYGLNEAAVIALMRRELKPASFRLWRKRVTGRVAKHRALQRKGEASPPPEAR